MMMQKEIARVALQDGGRHRFSALFCFSILAASLVLEAQWIIYWAGN